MTKKYNFPLFNLDMKKLKEMKSEMTEVKNLLLQAIDEDEEYEGEGEMIKCALDNLLEEIEAIKTANDLTDHKQSKILALFMWANKHLSPFADADDEDDEDLADFYDDDEDDLDDEECDEHDSESAELIFLDTIPHAQEKQPKSTKKK